MSYNSNKSYGNSTSYSFSSSTLGVSEYTPTSNQAEYRSKTVTSYSDNQNIIYNLSGNNGFGNSSGINSSYIGNASGKGTGMDKSSGRGGGQGVSSGRGKGAKRGQGVSSGKKDRGGMKQGCINVSDQFREDQKNNFQSDEADSAINEIQQTDSNIKIQKNPLDIMIEKLEEKNSKREQKKNNNKILKEK